MKKGVMLLYLLVVMAIPLLTVAQKGCGFAIDTNAILVNSQLGDFIAKIKSDKFSSFKTKEAIPVVVKDQLDCLAGNFSLADPGKPYRCCCTSSMRLPKRQLLYFAKSNDVLVMTYLTGGVGVSTSILLIKFDATGIRALWTGRCGEDLNSLPKIVKHISKFKHEGWKFHLDIVSL